MIGYKLIVLRCDIDKGFGIGEIDKLIEYNLYVLSDVLKVFVDGNFDFGDYDSNIGMLLKKFG